MSLVLHTDLRLFPATQQLENNPRFFRVLEPFSARTGSWATVVLPGFEYDCTSNIRPLWWFDAPGVGNSTPANLIHDVWYKCLFPDPSPESRELADTVGFRDLMDHYGERVFISRPKYWVTGSFIGGIVWRRKDIKEVDQYRQYARLIPLSEEDEIKEAILSGYLKAGENLENRVLNPSV